MSITDVVNAIKHYNMITIATIGLLVVWACYVEEVRYYLFGVLGVLLLSLFLIVFF